LRSRPGFQVCDPQSLSIVCFRVRPERIGDDEQQLNALNKAVLEDVQLAGRAFLSSTVIDNVFWLRACLVNPRTTDSDIHALVDAVEGSAARMAASASRP